MAILVYGVFADADASDAVVNDLAQRTDAHPSFAVQVHRGRVLDGDALPESGTEVAKNTTMATGVGAVAGLIIGVIGGATLPFAGFNVATGAGVGLLFGVLVGSLSGLMAGARQPKAALRTLAAEMGEGAVLVTVEVDDRGQSELAEDALGSAGARSVGRC